MSTSKFITSSSSESESSASLVETTSNFNLVCFCFPSPFLLFLAIRSARLIVSSLSLSPKPKSLAFSLTDFSDSLLSSLTFAAAFFPLTVCFGGFVALGSFFTLTLGALGSALNSGIFGWIASAKGLGLVTPRLFLFEALSVVCLPPDLPLDFLERLIDIVAPDSISFRSVASTFCIGENTCIINDDKHLHRIVITIINE